MAAGGEVKYLETYNSLRDEHLSEYLSRPSVWRHLVRQGLVRESGEVVGEEEWRAGVQRRSVRDRTDRERGREQKFRDEDKSRMMAKHRHKQQLLSNYALADRIRLQAERHHPAYVREEDFSALSQADREALGMDRKHLIVHLPPNSLDKPGFPADKPSGTLHNGDALTQSRSTLRSDSYPSVSQSSQSTRTSTSVRSLSRQSPYLPRPPKGKPHPPTLKRSPKRRLSNPGEGVASVQTAQKRRVFRTVQGGTPHSQSKATITLLFRGRGIRLNGRILQESSSEVCVYQQHCGGNAVEVYQGQLAPGASFSFLSRRHTSATLGLTFYLNGLVDTRLSACCEFRYKPGHKTSHYEFLSVSDATPCFRCQAEIEVDKFIAAGEKDEKSGQEKASVKNHEIREAWVNTSSVDVSSKEGYSSGDFEEPEDANKSEELESAFSPASCGERSVSRRSSVSSAQETSSISLDSDLDVTQSDSDVPAVPMGSNSLSESRDYSASLGQVTPDERLLIHSALSVNDVLSQISEHESPTQDCIETDHSSMYVPTNSSPTQDIATSTPMQESSSLQQLSDTLPPLQHSHNAPPDQLTPPGPLIELSDNPDTPSSLQHSITLPDALQPSHDLTDSPHSRSSFTQANSSSVGDVTSSCTSSISQMENDLEKECEKSQSLPDIVLSKDNSTDIHSVSVLSYSAEANTSYLDTNTPAHLISSATNTHNHSSDDVTISSSSDLDQNPLSDSPPFSISGRSLVILRNLTPSQFQELASLLSNEIVSKVVMEDARNFSPDHLDEILGRIKTLSHILISKSELTQDLLVVLLKHLKSVEELEISHSLLPPDHFNAFLNELPKSAPKLAKFNTSYCDISFSSSLTKILNSLGRLEVVNLSGNVIKSAINFEFLHTPNLQELYLDKTSMEEADLMGLTEYLKRNTKVHTLSLREITFSNGILQRLLDVLQENRTLKELLFSPQPEDLHIDTKLITDILDKRAI